MTMTFEGSVLGSNIVGSFIAVPLLAQRPGTNEIWIYGSSGTGDHVAVYDALSLTKLRSYAVAANAWGGLAFVTGTHGASGVFWSETANEQLLLEASSTYIKIFASTTTSDAITDSDRQQQAAGSLITTNIAIGQSNVAGNVNKFDGNTFSWSIVTLPFLKANKIGSIIAIPNGNFILGTDSNSIYEVDTNLNVVGSMSLERSPSLSFSQTIYGLSYYNDMLLAVDNVGIAYQIHWASKTMINREFWSSSNSSESLCLTDSASGETFLETFNTGTVPGIIASVDFVRTPVAVSDRFFFNSGATIKRHYCFNTQAQVLAFFEPGSTPKVYFFSVVPTRSTVAINSAINDSGFKRGRVIRIIDQNGTGSHVELDVVTTATATNSYLTSTGKTVYELKLDGSGINEKGSLSTYTT